MSKLNLDWSKWFKGLAAAVVGGCCNTVVAMIVDPVAFNFQDLPKLGKVVLLSGLISAALYLKQSPVPPEETE